MNIKVNYLLISFICSLALNAQTLEPFTTVDLVVCDNTDVKYVGQHFLNDPCPSKTNPILLIKNVGEKQLDSSVWNSDLELDYENISRKEEYLMKRFNQKQTYCSGKEIFYHKLFDNYSEYLDKQNAICALVNDKISYVPKNLDTIEIKNPPSIGKIRNFSLTDLQSKVRPEIVYGIDISHHNAIDDWYLLKNEGGSLPVSFVIMKATEGGDFKDRKFNTYWQQAKNAGIKRGAYHFYRQLVNPVKQANNFINQVGPLDHDDIIPVIDIEKYAGRKEIETYHYDLIENLKIFVKAVENHYGCKVMFYANNVYYDKYLRGYFPDNPFWVARYNINTPPRGFGSEKLGWQFTDRSRIQGARGSIDGNVFVKDKLHSILVKNALIDN